MKLWITFINTVLPPIPIDPSTENQLSFETVGPQYALCIRAAREPEQSRWMKNEKEIMLRQSLPLIAPRGPHPYSASSGCKKRLGGITQHIPTTMRNLINAGLL